MAITPYYREKGNGYPGPNGVKMPGQNFHEYQLLSLRTRVAHDPKFAQFAIEHGAELVYLPAIKGDRVSMELVIRKLGEYIPEKDYQEVEILRPDWLQELVDKWVVKNVDYSVIISDQYPIEEIPNWWLAEVMPNIDLTNLIQDVWFSNDDRLAEDYDVFYQGGAIYIQLVDDTKDHSGPYTPSISDFMYTGDRVVKRGESSYGDHADAHIRYDNLHIAVYYHLVNLYKLGMMSLPQNSHIIKDWNLAPYINGKGLYFPSWCDVRIYHYDGMVNLLQRQLKSHQSQWDYQNVYYYIGNNNLIKHYVVQYLQHYSNDIIRFYDGIIPVKVSNYKDAIIIANQIDYIKDVATGSVMTIGTDVSKTNKLPKIYYIEMSTQQLIESNHVEYDIMVIPDRINPELVKKYISEIKPVKKISESHKVLPKNFQFPLEVS